MLFLLNMMPPASQRSYDAKLRLCTINYALENENRATGRQFDLSEKMIWDWRKPTTVLCSTKPTQNAEREKKAR